MERAIILCLLLSGCSLFPKVPDPITVYKDKEIVCTVSKPLPISTLAIDIEVIQDTEGTWWVALGDEAYGNLAINNREVIRYIKDLHVYADTLNQCIADTKKES